MSNRADRRDYVLQDSRSNLGDLALFWARDGHGYTHDLNQAHRFTEAEALAQNQNRPTDIPHKLTDLKPATQKVIEAERLERVTQNKEQGCRTDPGTEVHRAGAGRHPGCQGIPGHHRAL